MPDVLSLAGRILDEAGVDYRRLSILTLDRSDEREPFFVLLSFLDAEREPTHLIKITGDGDRGQRLATEFENLSVLHERGTPALRQGLPRPVYFGELDGFTICAETAIAGNRMKNLRPGPYFASQRFARHFDGVLDWLAEFHRSCDWRADGRSLPECPSLDEAIETYRQHFRRSARLDRLLDDTRAHLARSPAPASPLHGDFCTANILIRSDDTLGVVDWEHPLGRHWALADLLHFLASIWVAPYGKGPTRLARNFSRLFFEKHPLAGWIRPAVLRHAAGLGVGEVDLLPLSVMAWVSFANQKRARIEDRAAGLDRASSHWPLILFENDSCLNLELLAEGREHYLLKMR